MERVRKRRPVDQLSLVHFAWVFANFFLKMSQFLYFTCCICEETSGIISVKQGANNANMLADNVLTVCTYQTTFLMSMISPHFERLLLDYLICLMLNNIDRIYIINNIDRIYIIKDINDFECYNICLLIYLLSCLFLMCIRNYLVTYQITKLLANISEHVQNELTLLVNIFMHHQHVVEMRKQHNIVGQHFYASPTCCRDAQTAQHCWPTFLCITSML